MPARRMVFLLLLASMPFARPVHRQTPGETCARAVSPIALVLSLPSSLSALWLPTLGLLCARSPTVPFLVAAPSCMPHSLLIHLKAVSTLHTPFPRPFWRWSMFREHG